LKSFLPWLILGYMGIVWGLSFSLSKIAVGLGGTPIGLTFWTCLLTGLMLLFYTIIRGQKIRFRLKDLQIILLLAFLGAMLPNMFFYYAAAHVSAGILSITITVVPIATYALSFILKLEAISARRITGVFFGVGAILVLVLPENSLPNKSEVIWIIVACLSSISYALENITLAIRGIDGIGPVRLSCGINLLAALILGIFSYFTDNFMPVPLPVTTLTWTILGISLIGATAYTLFVLTIANSGPLFASQVAFLVTISGVLWGMLIFGETHSSWVWLSLVLMLIGMSLVSPKRKS
jgi:drug/metabolite transporter (DMT)-like permease|tara:strand:- start:1804 stop:2685 length:882 start_codon:yes stop_codon:yes gene_type:complete